MPPPAREAFCLKGAHNAQERTSREMLLLRKDRQLSQADLGQRIGVNQKRVAKIEADPGVTSFDQIARIVSALGGRIIVQQERDA